MSLSRLANFFGTVSAAFNKPSQDNGQTPPTTRGGCTTLTCTPTDGNWLTSIFGKFTSGGVSAAHRRLAATHAKRQAIRDRTNQAPSRRRRTHHPQHHFA